MLAADALLDPSATLSAALQASPREKIKVKVVNGHLAFAKHPVLVGHCNGDTFAGAEAQLDRPIPSHGVAHVHHRRDARLCRYLAARQDEPLSTPWRDDRSSTCANERGSINHAC
jgi:hypothetical protein